MTVRWYGGQGVEAVLHGLGEPTLVEPGEGVALAAVRQVIFVSLGEVGALVELEGAAGVPSAQGVDGEVDHDAVEPGAEAGLTLEGVEVAVDAHEGVLGDLLGVFGVAHDAVGHGVGAALVARHELAKRAGVTLRGAFNELTVVGAVIGGHSRLLGRSRTVGIHRRRRGTRGCEGFRRGGWVVRVHRRRASAP
jgi:hypothetical protein